MIMIRGTFNTLLITGLKHVYFYFTSCANKCVSQCNRLKKPFLNMSYAVGTTKIVGKKSPTKYCVSSRQ